MTHYRSGIKNDVCGDASGANAVCVIDVGKAGFVDDVRSELASPPITSVMLWVSVCPSFCRSFLGSSPPAVPCPDTASMPIPRSPATEPFYDNDALCVMWLDAVVMDFIVYRIIKNKF